jgi:hypothetical protein
MTARGLGNREAGVTEQSWNMCWERFKIMVAAINGNRSRTGKLFQRDVVIE